MVLIKSTTIKRWWWIAALACMACSKRNTSDAQAVLPQLYGVTMPDLFQKAIIRNDTAFFNLPYGTKLSAIRVHIETSSSVHSSVAKDGVYDFVQPFSFTLSNGAVQKKYVIKAVVPPAPDTAIRGVWVTNVSSTALASPQQIAAMVNTVDQLGMNTIFVDVYNKSQTLHPSEVLKKAVGNPAVETQIFGGGWDPLKVVIDEAHAKGIRVIAWFEYGFISHYAGYPHPLLDAHPDWAAVDYSGQATVRNNFTWLNGFAPPVQQFLLDLITEVVSKYAIDGIQCDDHLPAMPVNSGYDSYTLDLYKKETGQTAPANNSDAAWVKWRADQLTIFAEKIRSAVKSIQPACMVSFAPGPLGWALQNNLQDWEQWMRKGLCDAISPLLYRRESQGLAAYTSLLDKDIAAILQPIRDAARRYFPGILVKSDNYLPSDNYLADCILYNRSKGIKGEVFFYFEGLANNEKVYKAFYPAKSVFPAVH